MTFRTGIFFRQLHSGCAAVALLSAISVAPASARSFDDPLINAADDGRYESVLSLLQSGSSPETRGRFGVTPLMRAAYNGHDKVVVLLASQGAAVNAEDVGGETALHMAARAGRVNTVGLLLRAGADANRTDNEGWTPLMRAVNSGDADTVTSLLNAGADPALKNGFGESAYTLALDARDRGVAEAIYSGASLDKLKDNEALKNAVLAKSGARNYAAARDAIEGGGGFASVFAPALRRTASFLRIGGGDDANNAPVPVKRAPVLIVRDAKPGEQIPAAAAPQPEPAPLAPAQRYTGFKLAAGVVTDIPPAKAGRSSAGLPVPVLKAVSVDKLLKSASPAQAQETVEPVPAYARAEEKESVLPLWVRAFSDALFKGEKPGSRPEPAAIPASQVQLAQSAPSAAPAVVNGAEIETKSSGGFFSLPFFNNDDDEDNNAGDAVTGNIFYVQFGTFADQRAAISEWENLRARLPIMNEFYPKVVPVYLAAPDSLRFRLRAGVFALERDASEVCKYFYDKGVDCLVVEAAGDEQSRSFLSNMAPVDDILRRAGADLPEAPASSKRRTSGVSVIADASQSRTPVTGLPWLTEQTKDAPAAAPAPAKKSTAVASRDPRPVPVPLLKPGTPAVYAAARSAPEPAASAPAVKPKPAAPAIAALSSASGASSFPFAEKKAKKTTAAPAVSAPSSASVSPAPATAAKKKQDPFSRITSAAPKKPTAQPAPAPKQYAALDTQKNADSSSSSSYMRNYLDYRNKKNAPASDGAAAGAGTPSSAGTAGGSGLSEAIYVPKNIAKELWQGGDDVTSAARKKLGGDVYRVTVTGFPDREKAESFRTALNNKSLSVNAAVNYGSSLSGRQELRLSPVAASNADQICKTSYAYGYVCSYVPLLD